MQNSVKKRRIKIINNIIMKRKFREILRRYGDKVAKA